jgi:hypothetical protein
MVDSQQTDNAAIETKGVPVVYCNQASLSMSFHDLRIYLAEAIPESLEVSGASGPLKQRQTVYKPSVSLVMTPEFAKTFATAIQNAIEKYVETFGALRVEPSQEQVLKTLSRSK